MTTVTLQAGNTDNRLAQDRWAAFVDELLQLLTRAHKTEIHFFGAPPTYSPWQNVAFVFDTEFPRELSEEVSCIRWKYDQTSVAWTEGETKFI